MAKIDAAYRLRAMRYVERVQVVKSWPNWISDELVRDLRRRGYTNAYEVFRGIAMAQTNFGGYYIEDELTDAGRRYLASKETNG